MRPLPILALLLCMLALVAGGCAHEQAHVPRAPVAVPVADPVVAGQQSKDEIVTASANSIDKIVEATPEAAPVKAETDSIRAAVAANPAADVKLLVVQFEEAVRLLREQLTAADKRATQLAAAVESLRNAEMRAQAKSLRVGALAAIALAGLLAYARQFVWAGALGAGSVLAFGLAQLVSQPWFMTACTVVVVLILAAVGWAAVHAYRKHELAAKVEKEAAKLKDALVRVVPAVDSAIDELGDAGAKVKAKLRSAMTGATGAKAKATIHEIRAAAKLSEPTA